MRAELWKSCLAKTHIQEAMALYPVYLAKVRADGGAVALAAARTNGWGCARACIVPFRAPAGTDEWDIGLGKCMLICSWDVPLLSLVAVLPCP